MAVAGDIRCAPFGRTNKLEGTSTLDRVHRIGEDFPGPE
jgi:hypothetical protein